MKKPSEVCYPGRSPETARFVNVSCGVIMLLLVLFFGTMPRVLAQQEAEADTDVNGSPRPSIYLTLPKAVEMALRHNRQIELARLSTAESEQKRTIARSDYYPHISNLSSVSYLTALEGIVIPAGIFGNSVSTRIDQGGTGTYSSGTTLSQPLTQLFKVHAEDKAADAGVKIASIDEKDAENSISLKVHTLYFAILTAQAGLSSAHESVAAAVTMEQESTSAVAEGNSLELSLLESHATLLDQQQSVLKTQLSIGDLMLQFDDVLGLSLGTKLVLDQDALGAAPELPSRSEATAMVSGHSLKVLEAQQTVEKAKAGLLSARTAYIPNISAQAQYSYQSGIPFLVHNFGTFSGLVTYDLFDGGAREAKLKQARIQLAEAQTQLAQTESDVSIQLAAAYDKVEQLQNLLAVSQDALKTRMEAARIAKQRLEQNAALASAVAKDGAAVYFARASVLETRLQLYLAQSSIQQMLGELP